MTTPASSRSTDWARQIETATLPEDRYQALGMLVRAASPEQKRGWLQRGLNDSDPAVQALAEKELGGLSPIAELIPPLEARLAAEDPDVRFEAARTLVRWNHTPPPILEVLLTFLADAETQPLMLANLVELLGSFGESAARIVPLVRPLLTHPQPEVRENSLRALGKFGPVASSAVLEIVPLIDDDEPFVREYAALALGQIGVRNETVLAGLQAATNDEDEVVAEIARAALDKLKS